MYCLLWFGYCDDFTCQVGSSGYVKCVKKVCVMREIQIMQIVLIICIGGVNEKVRGYAQIAARAGSRNRNANLGE